MGDGEGIETHICGHYDLMGTSRHVARAASQVKLIYTAIKHQVMKNYQEQDQDHTAFQASFKIILLNIQEIRDWESVQRRTQSQNISESCVKSVSECAWIKIGLYQLEKSSNSFQMYRGHYVNSQAKQSPSPAPRADIVSGQAITIRAIRRRPKI